MVMRRREAAGDGRLLAFTLIELLVVIAVMVVVAALLLPALTKSRERGRSAACLSNLHQIGMSLQMFVLENENTMPIMYDAEIGTNAVSSSNTLLTIDVVLSNYLGNPYILRCPSDKSDLFTETGSSYSWNSLLNEQDAEHLSIFAIDLEPINVPLVFDKEAFHASVGKARGVNYLYADGHAQSLLAIDGTKVKRRRR